MGAEELLSANNCLFINNRSVTCQVFLIGDTLLKQALLASTMASPLP